MAGMIVEGNVYASGEENGATFKLLMGEGTWTVVIELDGRRAEESFPWGYEPRYGIDAEDSAKADEVTDRLIATLRAQVEP